MRAGRELGASLLILSKGATIGAERVQLGRYLVGKRNGDFVDVLLFPAHRILSLIFSFLKHARAAAS